MEPLSSYGNFLNTSLLFYNANAVNEPLQFSASDVKDLFSVLNEEGVKYLLVGGFALAFHGYFRGTVDLDVWVEDSPSNKKAIARAFGRLGVIGSELLSIMPFVAGFTSFHLGANGFEVDMRNNLFLFKASSFQACYQRCAEASILGVPVMVLSKEDLIKEKESTGRPKDTDDAEQLKKTR
ncbi:hypothetical protein QWY31_04405 [Cytophagales bacterium LB-30]|uniref:Nucleotidyltransferase family protein n=1 Tax=Shiella aurantiaca TaxID=3058365 RepID=A0ABT8F379_9BACT|nr:hypothetical protein [Shiella aurantiaca]MDN4164729.1 hypothetical protein [Shiella aurantiaca]